MRKSWKYHVEGVGAEGATFECKGTTLCEFQHTFTVAMEDAFHQLTNGRAVYGSPGVGCRGPYDIRKITIEQVKQ